MTSSRSDTFPSPPEPAGQIVLAGVGCRGRGDDAFGPLLARRLAGCASVLALDCGDRLEDFTGDIAQARPKVVLIVDAVELEGRPGDLALMDAAALPLPTDTHRPSLRVAMEYLRMRTGARVLLLGVQPGIIADSDELSQPVAARLEQLAELLQRTTAQDGSEDRS